MAEVRSLVKEFRMQRHVAQSELAEAVGVCRKTIYFIETGNRSPTLVIALRLARYFDTSVEKLFILEE